MKVTADQLAGIFGVKAVSVGQWVEPINAVIIKAELNTRQRLAMFLAQVGHESANLTAVRENLNYGADGLLGTFGKYFDKASAARYARKPEAIANRVYANRMSNGNEASGDGWKFRGRGLIQVTGKANYIDCGAFLGLDLLNNPELLETNLNAALSAGWYWSTKGLNAFADRQDVEGATRRINGGLNGLTHRQSLYTKALNLL